MKQRKLLTIGLDAYAPGKDGIYEVETIFDQLTPAEQVGLIGLLVTIVHDFEHQLKRGENQGKL